MREYTPEESIAYFASKIEERQQKLGEWDASAENENYYVWLKRHKQLLSEIRHHEHMLRVSHKRLDGDA